MCGITGIAGLVNEIQRNTVIRKMNDRLSHPPHRERNELESPGRIKTLRGAD